MNSPALPHDISGPIPLPPPLNWPVILLSLLCALFIILGVIYFIISRRRANKLSLQEKTLQRLRALHSRKNSETGQLWLSEVSQVLRDYIEKRFELPSTRSTTREFLHSKQLKLFPGLKQFQGELQTCLELSDLVKFAHMPATAEQLDQVELAIENFVVKTELLGIEPVKGGSQ